MPRFTFKQAQKIASDAGFILETSKGGYSYWKKGEDHTEGWASTITEALEDMEGW